MKAELVVLMSERLVRRRVALVICGVAGTVLFVYGLFFSHWFLIGQPPMQLVLKHPGLWMALLVPIIGLCYIVMLLHHTARHCSLIGEKLVVTNVMYRTRTLKLAEIPKITIVEREKAGRSALIIYGRGRAVLYWVCGSLLEPPYSEQDLYALKSAWERAREAAAVDPVLKNSKT